MRYAYTAFFAVTLLASSTAWAGASSSSDMGSGGSRIEKINRHALKSAVLIRQLLAQNGVPGMVAAK